MGGICQRNQFCIRRARRPRRAVCMICPSAARRVVAPYQCGIIFSKIDFPGNLSLVLLILSRCAATAIYKPGCAGLVPGLGIDFLPYMKTRRFVFPQMGPEKGGELPGKGQRIWKFSGGGGGGTAGRKRSRKSSLSCWLICTP